MHSPSLKSTAFVILASLVAMSLAFTPEHLEHINASLSKLSPQEIIKWAIITFPSLYQTTAFGLTGLAITDMVSKISVEMKLNEDKLGSDKLKNAEPVLSATPPQHTSPKPAHAVDLIFIDTLYHFPQTYDLVEKVKLQYDAKVHVFKPKNAETEADFVATHGDQLWDNEEEKYDYLVKVEPSQRAYKDLGVVAALTGRRQSQGGVRATLPIIEVEQVLGVVKINPLCACDFQTVRQYIADNKVPYNPLLDLGYKSIGDWHSTLPVGEDGDERSGRWSGKAKTECGIHMAHSFSHHSDASV